MAACAPLYVKMTRVIDVFLDITLGLGVDVALTLTQKKIKELIDIPILEQHKYKRTQDFVQTKHDVQGWNHEF